MSIEGEPCLDCGGRLEAVVRKYMPGGVMYLCPGCRYEYTENEYRHIERDISSTNASIFADLFISSGNTDNGNLIKLGSETQEIAPSLKQLLSESDSTEEANPLLSYEDPIDEV